MIWLPISVLLAWGLGMEEEDQEFDRETPEERKTRIEKEDVILKDMFKDWGTPSEETPEEVAKRNKEAWQIIDLVFGVEFTCLLEAFLG